MLFVSSGSNGTSLPPTQNSPPPVVVPPGARWLHYLEDPNDPNVLFNLTGSLSSVYVDLTNTAYNDMTGASCGGPPCSPTNGMWSYQFNVVFPTDSNFMLQDVIEVNTVTNSCYAHGQSSSGTPSTPTYSFACSNILLPGENFKWVIDSSSNLFVDTKFVLNGVTAYTWTSSAVFGCSSCISMKDVYAQSVWAGAESGPLNYVYANLYSGQGDMDYAGVNQFNCGSSTCVIVVTVEYSNAQYTNPTGSGTTWNQTYDAGVLVSSYVASGATGTGSVTNPAYIVGPPDGLYATVAAPNSPDTAYDEGSFGSANSGTLVIYGYSYNNGAGAYYSRVQVQASSDGSTWTTVYTNTWSPSSNNQPAWVTIASVTGIKYVKVTVSYYSGYSARIYIDSISLFISSYAQSETNSGHSGGGTVTNPTYVVGPADGLFTLLTGPNSGDSSWVEGNFGALYSGQLVIDGYSYNNGVGAYNSYVQVQVSSDGVSWSTVYTNFWAPSSTNTPTWITIGSVSNIQYVKVTVSFHSGWSAKVYIDAWFVA